MQGINENPTPKHSLWMKYIKLVSFYSAENKIHHHLKLEEWSLKFNFRKVSFSSDLFPWKKSFTDCPSFFLLTCSMLVTAFLDWCQRHYRLQRETVVNNLSIPFCTHLKSHCDCFQIKEFQIKFFDIVSFGGINSPSLCVDQVTLF